MTNREEHVDNPWEDEGSIAADAQLDDELQARMRRNQRRHAEDQAAVEAWAAAGFQSWIAAEVTTDDFEEEE